MTLDLNQHLKDMLNAPGISGYEEPVRQIVADVWKELSDELQVSPLGSLHALKRGEGKEPRPKVMLAAHMDAIGMLVTNIQDGFLRFVRVGGVDPRVLPGQMVTVHATAQGPEKAQDLPGMVVLPPQHLLPQEAGNGAVDIPYLLVDIGLRPAEVEELVRVGDLISFAQEPLELSGGTLAGHTLDNRASVAAVTVCLDLLQRRRHVWDVYAVATSQEELGIIGGFTSPVMIKPDFAIVSDVTFAIGPGWNSPRGYKLGEGITITNGANMHPALFKAMTQTADAMDLPYHKEFAPGMSGTDAYGVQIVEQGIPVVNLGIPLRYMHTPVELVALKDVRRAGRLMAEFISELSENFMESVIWE